MSKILYYSSITKRNGSWQDSDGYILSDNKEKLETKIASMPKHEEHASWEYSKIESFESTKEKYDRFCKYAKEGILWIDDFELGKYALFNNSVIL